MTCFFLAQRVETLKYYYKKHLLYQSKAGDFKLVTVSVRDNNVEQALRVLKKKMQREGIFREMKERRDFEKPTEKRKREKQENIRRSRKAARKRNND